MKIYVIAGEDSGDKLGAALIKELQSLHQHKELSFKIIGGDSMEGLGFKSLFPIKDISLIGFAEILPHIFKLYKLIKLTIADIIFFNPDILITIDSPGFSLRVAKRVKAALVHCKLVHYVAPSVWAYKASRAKKFAKIYDLLLVLFPFEKNYFPDMKLEVCGHPIFDKDYDKISRTAFREKFQISKATKLICITPGSRVSEINKHMGIIVDSINLIHKKYPEVVVAIPAANESLENIIKGYLKSINCKTIITNSEEDKLLLYRAADLAIAKSGTNTLELASCKTPHIVFYKINFLSYFLIKKMIYIKFVSLVNIVLGKEIVPEFLQNDFTAEALSSKALEYLGSRDLCKLQLEKLEFSLEKLKPATNLNASTLAAQAIINYNTSL